MSSAKLSSASANCGWPGKKEDYARAVSMGTKINDVDTEAFQHKITASGTGPAPVQYHG
jgi:hypothetical protein